MIKKLLLTLSASFGLFAAAAQPMNVTGVVRDEAGTPVSGAIVRETGTQNTALSMTDGAFHITVSGPAAKLDISFGGYADVTLPAQDKMTVRLEKSDIMIEEIVVTGMNKVDKRLFTGASDKLVADDVMLSGVADVSRSLEGRSAGVTVQNVSATFGTAPKIRVRGATSILGNSKPLWVVDGVIIEDVTEVGPDDLSSGDAVTMISSAIAGLNADDIESFNILKDGSATSIYGAKAMAGVIVITTKKGRPGTTRLNYSGEFTMRLKPSYSQYNLLDSQEQMDLLLELRGKGFLKFAETIRASESGVFGHMYRLMDAYDATKGVFGMPNTPEAENAYLQRAKYRNTDWFDLLFNNTVMMNHSVSMSTGTEKSTSYMSLSAMTDPGWYERSKVERYTFNANTNFSILPNLSLNILGNANYRKQLAPGTLSQDTDVVSGAVKRDFDINPYSFAMTASRTMHPEEYYTRNYTSFNIFEELQNNYIDLNALEARFQAELKWQIIPSLEFSSLVSYRYNSSSMQHHIRDDSNQARAYREMSDSVIRGKNPFLYTDPDIANALPVSILPEGGIFEKREYRTNSYTVRNSVSWNRIFNGIHIINAYGGMEITEIKRSNDWFRGWGMQYNEGEIAFFNYLAFKKASEDTSPYYSLDNSIRRTAAFFGTVNYSFKGKYNVNGTLRYEGTNRLGTARDSRWLPTWNVGGGWNVHEESFFKAVGGVLSHLNLKASYSLTADAGPDYISNANAIHNSYIPWRPTSGDQESGIQIVAPGNRNLTYEKKHEFNVGFSTGFLENRINLEMDLYWRNNFDLLGVANTQGYGGAVKQYANVANMKSNGVELTVSTRNILRRDFRWTTDLTFAWSRQQITKLGSDARLIDMILGGGYNLEGYAPHSLFSIPFTGLDNEGLPTFSLGGRTVSRYNYSTVNFQSTSEDVLNSLIYNGPSDPVFSGGLGNVFIYKNLRLNIFMTYGFGNYIRMNPIFSASYADFYAMSGEFVNRWVNPGDEKITNIPVISDERRHAQYGSSNLAIGYNAYNYSTARIAKGDFIRMKEISLTYDFPKEMIRSLRFENLSLKMQVTNPFLVYAHKSLNGQDPEYYQSGGVSSPLAQQFTFTVKIGF